MTCHRLKQRSDVMDVHVGCLNIRSLTSSRKQGRFLNYVRARDLEVIAATET